MYNNVVKFDEKTFVTDPNYNKKLLCEVNTKLKDLVTKELATRGFVYSYQIWECIRKTTDEFQVD